MLRFCAGRTLRRMRVGDACPMRLSARARLAAIILPLCLGLVLPAIRWCHVGPIEVPVACLVRCDPENMAASRSPESCSNCPMARHAAPAPVRSGNRPFCIVESSSGLALRGSVPRVAPTPALGILLPPVVQLAAIAPAVVRREQLARARPPTFAWRSTPQVRGPPAEGRA